MVLLVWQPFSLYRSAQNLSKTLHCLSMHSITHTLPDCNMPPMEADAAYHRCLPSCEPRSTCCEANRQSSKLVDCAYKSCDLEIVHVCYAISRLECNLWILRMCNAISRLRGTDISIGWRWWLCLGAASTHGYCWCRDQGMLPWAVPWNCPLSFFPKWFFHFVFVGHDSMLHVFHHGLLYKPVPQGMGDVPSRWKHEVRMTTWGFSFVNYLDWKKIARQRSTENSCNLAFISNPNHLNMLWTILFHCPGWEGHDFNSSLFPV